MLIVEALNAEITKNYRLVELEKCTKTEVSAI